MLQSGTEVAGVEHVDDTYLGRGYGRLMECSRNRRREYVALGQKYQEPRTEPKILRTEPKIPKSNFSVPYSVPNSQEPKLPR